jgi:diamine N-acetyltransferase
MGGEGRAAPIINISGELVALGPLRRELVPLYQRWANDFGTQRTLGALPRPLTVEAEHSRYERVTGAPDEIPFTIYERATLRPIGIIDLQEIDYRQRTAEYAIFIGEPEVRGLGYGTEATRLVLGYAFAALGLHSVMLRVYEYNLAGLRAYHKAGFKEFGRWRQSHWMGGRLWDTILMDCLASEFTGGRGQNG